MALAEKKSELMAKLSAIKDPQERLAWLLAHGRKRPPLPPELKNDVHRLQGCLSKLWIVAEFRDGKCHFQTDADSHIVKAIASLLCDLSSGETPEEILAADPSFLREVGITQHLSANRRNALSHVWEFIRGFALKHRSIP